MRFGSLSSSLLPIALAVWTAMPAAAAEAATHEGVAKPFQSVIMSASLRETITQIAVSEGDRIRKGQILVELEVTKEKLAVERLAQMVAKAEFDHTAAKRLFAKNVSSRDEMLSKELELKRLQAELDIAKADVAERQMLAPFDGVVVHRYHEPGEAVNETEPILKVIDADKLLLLFYLEAPMLSELKMEQVIEVSFPAMSPPLRRQAAITFIDPEVDARSGMFRVRLLMDNVDHAVRPGMKVQGEFPSMK